MTAERRDQWSVHIMYGLLLVVLKTAWLNRWRPRILWAVTLLGVGMFFGVMLFMNVLMTYGDSIIERWSWTDAIGHSWECSRVPGSKSLCSRQESGEMIFYHDKWAEPSPCTIIETKVR